MSTLLSLVILFSVVAIVYLWRIKVKFSYFHERGIPSPRSDFFFGHLKKIWSTPLKTRQWQKWTNEYGSIYGLYEGYRPVYIVSDANFIEQVFIRQFSSFNSRHLPFILREASKNEPSLFSATSDDWHRQRQIINPAFSSGKLKLMASMIHKCVESFVIKLKEFEQTNQSLDIYMFYKRLTMDVLCHCVFGAETDIQNDVNNEYFIKAEQAVAYNFDKNILVRISQLVPPLIPILVHVMLLQLSIQRFVDKFTGKTREMPRFWLMKRLQQLIDMRTIKHYDEKTHQRRVDLLQLMLDVANKDEISNSHPTTKTIHHDEISHNMLSFMIAGYETTATTLAYCTYVLSKETHIQKKLQDELDSVDIDHDEYDQVHNIEYLDWFIREVLRMYPPAPQATSRLCNKTTTVCGHIIDHGSVVQPDLLSIHYSSDLWGPDDPNLFIPERHSIIRHVSSFLSFGLGPRNCIGKRFALTEIKMCLARLLKLYSIQATDQIDEHFQLKDTSFIVQPEYVYVRIVKR